MERALGWVLQAGPKTVAEGFNVAPSCLYSLCQERGIKVLQADQEDFREDLERANQFLDSGIIVFFLDSNKPFSSSTSSDGNSSSSPSDSPSIETGAIQVLKRSRTM